MAAERLKIEAALPKNARIVALDERGKDWTTMQLAGALPGWQQDGRDEPRAVLAGKAVDDDGALGIRDRCERLAEALAVALEEVHV